MAGKYLHGSALYKPKVTQDVKSKPAAGYVIPKVSSCFGSKVLQKLSMLPRLPLLPPEGVGEPLGARAESLPRAVSELQGSWTLLTRDSVKFQNGSEIYQFSVLLFGLSTSPREFTKMLSPLALL